MIVKRLFRLMFILSSPFIAEAQVSMEPVPVVPDDFFIQRECEWWAKAAEFPPQLRPLGWTDQQTRESRERWRKDVLDLCTQVRNGALSRDDWFSRLEPIAQRIHNSFRCPSCLTRFLPERAPLPGGFDAYALFLIPSPSLVKDRSWIGSLKKQFEDFGESIGTRKAAVWFGEQYSNFIDVPRSKFYCDLFRLNYNDGPYVVVTNVRPDTLSSGKEAVFVKLNNITGERVLRVLNVLEQDLRTEREVRRRALEFEEIKQRLLTVVERHRGVITEIGVSWLKK